MTEGELKQYIFNEEVPFVQRALTVFEFQYEHIPIYRSFCQHIHPTPSQVRTLQDIPFLPIELFKYHQIIHEEKRHERIFRSSGTTGQTRSHHFVADVSLYEQAILDGFEKQYGNVKNYCIVALLPSYLERKDASLVYMADYLMSCSGHPDNGFYLDQYQALQNKLKQLVQQEQPTILIGVTFALLDLAEQYPTKLNNVIIMETGGMKGRRKELTRSQLHQQLTTAFEVEHIHSEYGMTELLSQAYFQTNGYFSPSSTMRVLIREINDPFSYQKEGRQGALNIIDLANLYSCSFIATQDVGYAVQNNQFQVLGRMDSSDVRGCNLMVYDG